MRITVDINEDLLNNAASYGGIDDHSDLVTAALTLLVQREAARRLIRLQGTHAGP